MPLISFLRYRLFLFAICIFIFSCKQECNEVQEDNNVLKIKNISKQPCTNKRFDFFPAKEIVYKSNIECPPIVSINTFLITNSPQEIYLTWKKLKVDIPSAWSLHFCDNIKCYVDFPGSGDLKPITKTQDYKRNPMKLFVEHNNISGKGIIKILVFEKRDPIIADTITYNITI